MSESSTRPDGRANDQLRPVAFKLDLLDASKHHVLIHAGKTMVLCTASIEESVPSWREGRGLGWITAEYSMLPGSTSSRARRERSKIGGRTQEIQRLIGRSLRAVCDFHKLGERSITIDCDVLQADGGTRTASITGGYVALARAVGHLLAQGLIEESPLTDAVAAISVGIVDGIPVLDLPYVEDVRAEVDMNIVMNGQGRFIEVQGTAEGMTFSRQELDALLGLAEGGIHRLLDMQRQALSFLP